MLSRAEVSLQRWSVAYLQRSGVFAPIITVSNNTFVSRNTLLGLTSDERVGSGPIIGIQIEGDRNTIMHNSLNPTSHAGGLDIGITVQGEMNVLDGNILNTSPEGAGNGTGIEFLSDGNFYGNNRMNALVPFDLGATVQTDWGGNVGF